MEEIENRSVSDTAEVTDEVRDVAYKADASEPPRYTEMHKRRSGAGCFLLSVFIVLLAAFVAAAVIVIINDNKTDGRQKPQAPSQFSSDEAFAETAEPTYFPGNTQNGTLPTPVATQRPMTQYDGTAPVITDTGNPFPEVIQSVQSGVVSIYNYGKAETLFGKSEEGLQGSGSGFVISSDGYCVTNAHVITGATRVTIVLSDDKEVPCEVIGSDVTTDIAVLHFDNSTLGVKPLFLGNSDAARVGEFVITVGDPSGRELAGTITFGIISAVNREVNIDGKKNTYIQTDAAMNPGNSGGPLINAKGEVIGVTSAKTVTASYDEFGNAISAEGLGFAIPINNVKTIVESLITKGRIVRPGIGVTVRPATEDELAGANISYGLFVNSVVAGGPGAKAGIESGDFILSCNGTELHENDDLVSKVQSAQVGDTLKMLVWKASNGSMVTVEVTVGDLNNMG